MSHIPNFDQFSELARGASVVPVYRQLTGDTLTPVTAFGLLRDAAGCFLFESVVGGERIGRYSFVGSRPFLHIQAWGPRVEIWTCDHRQTLEAADPFDVLAQHLAAYQAATVPGLPRFSGGAVGCAGYDCVRYSEHLPHPPPDDRHLPDFAFALFDRMVIFDHLFKTVSVVANVRVQPETPLEDAYRIGCEAVDTWVNRLQQAAPPWPLKDLPSIKDRQYRVRHGWTSNMSQETFEKSVEKAKEYIKSGDIFQVVLSQRLETQTSAEPFDIYRALRVVNPSPFMFYLEDDPLLLIGSSPEIMVRVEGRTVTTRPLAGTRRRGHGEAEDRALALELLADPKERAEHIMLVDLGRNDVGRIAELGTVRLSELMTVERYSHVMHLSSTVQGELKQKATSLDALRACLPAGTLSGAPKVRAMEIIDELEPCRRGPYGGAIGYIDFTGNLDTCIALRTLVMQQNKVYIQAGAGVVHDSRPNEEYQETLNKAMVLLQAIELAESYLSTS